MSNKLGSILVDLGYLTPDRLAEAETAASIDGRRFGEHLVQMGFVQEDDVTHALAVQCGLRQVKLAELSVSRSALQSLPADMVQRYRVFPLSADDGHLELAMADPFDMTAVDDISAMSGMKVVRSYVRATELAEAVKRHYGTSAARMADSLTTDEQSEEAEVEDAVGHLHELAREPSLINLVNLIILEAVQDHATDIHIEPFEYELRVKYRIDGLLHEMSPPSKHLQAAIISRIKIMSSLDIAERFIPQDGHINFVTPEANVDIRVSTVPTMFGESVVMRILDKSATLQSLDDLGMDVGMLAVFDRVLRRPHGVLLVTGPTGSGKTTSLYAGLNHIYTPGKKIITIEDPVEFNLNGVNQIQVNPKRGLTFANGLRSILRQDPDIIMVGEIRDGETADIAVRSALTGHMVLSSLHTNDSAGAMTRLLDMGIEPYLLSTTIEAVVAQRLVRLVCQRCAEQYTPSAQVLEQLGSNSSMFEGKTLLRGKGCQECRNTGYRGRIGIFEMITMTDALGDLIMEKPSSSQIRRVVGSEFVSMRQDGYKKVLAGGTSLEEVWRVTQDVDAENGFSRTDTA